MGHVIDVVWKEKLAYEHGAVGRSIFTTNLIELQTHTEEFGVDYIRQTFWHEVAHWVMHLLSYDELNQDEQFIDQLGQMLFQLSVSMQFDEEVETAELDRLALEAFSGIICPHCEQEVGDLGSMDENDTD